MTLATYTFERGEDVTIALDIVSGGTVDDVTAISAKLRGLAPGQRTLAPDAAVAATFDVTERAAAGDIPEGWTLLIPAAESVDLDAGNYLADARITIAGGEQTTESVMVRIVEPATLA